MQLVKKENSIDLTKSFDEAGFDQTPSGAVFIRTNDLSGGSVYNLSNYSSVQAFMNSINSNANFSSAATISYDSATNKFTIQMRTPYDSESNGNLYLYSGSS